MNRNPESRMEIPTVNLEFLDQDRIGRVWSLNPGNTRVGRAPDNDLVIPEPAVSGYHLVIQAQGGSLSVRDLGSTNGTFINEVRLSGQAKLSDGDLLRIGLSVRARVRIAAVGPPPLELWLIHQNTGRSSQLRSGDLLEDILAGDDFADPEGDELHKITLDGQEIHVKGPNFDRKVYLGQSFQVGPHWLVVVDGAAARERTLTEIPERPWLLSIDVEAGGGPEMEVMDPDGISQGLVRAGNRVSVLHMLATQVNIDRELGYEADDVGWCLDENLMRGVWGRLWAQKGAASFQVLVHRVRKDLVRMGLSGALIEKRGGRSRLRPGSVVLQLKGTTEY